MTTTKREVWINIVLRRTRQNGGHDLQFSNSLRGPVSYYISFYDNLCVKAEARI